MSLELKLAIEGSLSDIYRHDLDAGERAAMAALRGAADEGKSLARAQVIAAGLGTRVANAWRSAVYPSRGQSLNGAAFIFTRAPRIVRAFNEGAIIRSSKGRYLAIPTDAVPKNVSYSIGDQRIRRQRATPQGVERALGVKLRFVPARGQRPGLLVLDDARLTSRGIGRQASRTAVARGRVATVVMFILVPQVRLQKRLDVAAIETRVADGFTPRFLSEWDRLAA